MSSKKQRLHFILVVGLLALSAAGFYLQFFRARPIGSGPAGPAVDQECFKQSWTERPVYLLGIGDSITAGLGARSKSHSYFQRLIQNPDDEYPDMVHKCLSRVLPQLSNMNIAVSGSTSLQHAEWIESRVSPQDKSVFGIVVMTTGGNDIIHNYGRTAPKEGAMYGATLEQASPWIEAFQDRLEQMLRRIDEAFPGGCEIYLADIYDPTDGIGDAPSVFLPHWPDGLAIHAKYNQAIRACVKNRSNVFIVPLHETFLGHGSHCRQFWRSTYRAEAPYYWYFENIEDPNDRGYDAIRRVFLNTIVEHSQLVQKSL